MNGPLAAGGAHGITGTVVNPALVISDIQTLAIADWSVPDGLRLRSSIGHALESFGEIAVWKHEARLTRCCYDDSDSHIRAVESSVCRRIQVRTNHLCTNKHTTKLGHRRDSARRQSLRRSRSFEVTDVGTNRKHVCDFLLVNNTNL